MGRGIQAAQAADSRGDGRLSGAAAAPGPRPPGRRRRPKEVPPLGEVLAKTERHFLPGLPAALGALPDARDPDRIVYPKQLLAWSGILIPLLGLGSRRQFRFEADTPAFAANLNALAHAHCETAPHDDTIVYYLKGVRPEPFEGLPAAVQPQFD